MKRLLIATALLANACTPPAEAPGDGVINAAPSLEGVTLPVSDAAGNRMEAMTQAGDRWCTGDQAWCVIATEGAPLQVVHGDATMALADAGEAWPNIIRLSGDASAIVGVVTVDQQMYSGGSGSARSLTLYDVANGASRDAGSMPLAGSADIRACFDEDDEQQRAGACRDEYEFVTRISLDEGVASGPPRIILETAAGSYPGRVTRSADSLERAPLTEADLVWVRDDVCSYRRTYGRSSAGPYVPDMELPACSDYLEP